MTPEAEIDRAGKAYEILNNEVFKDAVSQIETALLEGIKRAPLKDEVLRERICAQIVALDSILKALRSTIDTGKLAKEQLRVDASKVSRIREAFGY